MNKETFNKNIKELENKYIKIVKEYIDSQKIYNENDILKISFIKFGEKYIFYCRIINIYLKPQNRFMSTMSWATDELVYFARYCWRNNQTNQIILGDHCPLGELSDTIGNVCGHKGIDYDTLKIEVIDESKFQKILK